MNESTAKFTTIIVTILAVLAVEGIAWKAGYISIGIAGMPGGGVPANINLPPITDMRSLSGTVQEVGSSFVKFKLSMGSMKIPGSSVRVAEVNKDTVIEKLVAKDPAVFNKENQEFLKKIQGAAGIPGPGLTPPDPFERVTLSIKDLKVGDSISASANENILKADTFTATRISVQNTAQPMPAVPAVNTPPPVKK